MTYCTNCGNDLGETLPEAIVDEAELVSRADVEIARINADRDIALAKLAAKVSENELVVENAALGAAVEVLEDVVSPDAPEPEPAEVIPVIVDVDAGGDAVNEEDAGTDLAPGIDEEHHESKHRAGIGMW
jgi:hypothetical protein